MRNYINLIESFNYGQPTISRSEISKIEDPPSCLGNWVDMTVESFDSVLSPLNMKEHKSLRDISYEPMRFSFQGFDVFSLKLHDSSVVIAISSDEFEDSLGIMNPILENIVDKITTITGLKVVGISYDPHVVEVFKKLNLPILV